MSLLGKLIGKLIDNGGSPTPPPYDQGFLLNDTGGYFLNHTGGKFIIRSSQNVFAQNNENLRNKDGKEKNS